MKESNKGQNETEGTILNLRDKKRSHMASFLFYSLPILGTQFKGNNNWF